MLALILKLIIGHALADFALQPTSMAMGKNRNRQWEGLKEEKKYFPNWPYWLTAHALLHGGAVWLITGNMVLGIAEIVLHWIIDFAKCENWTNIHTDQLLHLICKGVYLLFV
jgi:hypothetical protein